MAVSSKKILKYVVAIITLVSLSITSGINVKATTISNGKEEELTNEVKGKVQEIVKEIRKPPIIVIPGIMGSNLYQDEECKNLVWANVNLNPFSSTGIYKLGNNIDISKNLYPKAAVNEVPLSEDDREYGVLGVYKTIINRLCDEFPDREVYFFSYDFRQSNADTAKKLKDFIDNKIKADSVDLVCHSMGNSVAANYALLDKSKIDKLISLGGVHEGAPKIVNATLKWSVISTTWNPADFLLGLCGLQKKVKAGFSSISELFPTKKYFNSTTFSTKIKDGALSSHTENLSYEGYEKYCKTIFGLDKYNNSKKVQSSLYVGNTGILATINNAYFAIGTGEKTISAVNFKDGDTLDDLEIDSLVYENNGDGTVPQASLTMMNTLQSSKTANVKFFEGIDHGNVIVNDTSLAWIVDVIRTGDSTLGSKTITKGKPYIVLRAKAPVNINVSKDGQELDSSEENLSLESDYGRLDFVGGNEDIKMLAVDDEESDEYSIDLKGTDEGNMDFSVAWYDEDNNLKEERVIKDVPVTATSDITTSIDENNETKLMVDENGDGNVDSTIVYSKESEDNKVITLVKKDNSGDDNNFVDDSKTYNGIEESKENKEDLEELVNGNDGQAVSENLSSETAVIESCITSNRNWMVGVAVLVLFVALGGLYFRKNRRAR